MRAFILWTLGLVGLAATAALCWLFVLDGGLAPALWDRDAALQKLPTESRAVTLAVWAKRIETAANQPVTRDEINNKDIGDIVRGLTPGPREVLGPVAQSVADAADSIRSANEAAKLKAGIQQASASMSAATAKWDSLTADERASVRANADAAIVAMNEAEKRAPEEFWKAGTEVNDALERYRLLSEKK